MMSSETFFELASRSYESGNSEDAFQGFLLGAEHGDPYCMERVAFMYASGKGVNYSFEKSIEWDKKAAALGHVVSLFNLGISYRTRGNCKEARDWFIKSLAKGESEAALELAKLFLVSDKERDTIKNYLAIVLDSVSSLPGTKDEARKLLQELDPSN